MSERDLDAEFERIIAGWDDEAPDPQLPPRGPSTEEPDAAASASVADDALAAPDPTTDASADGGTPPAPPAPPAPPGTPAPGPTGSSGLLELPIAPTTSHAWRSGTPRRDDADDVDDDHFVPPSEIDLPSAETDPMFWAIVGGLVGGPLLLLYVLFFDRDGSGWWVATALAMIVVGFVLLVLRGGTERDPFDDGTRL